MRHSNNAGLRKGYTTGACAAAAAKAVAKALLSEKPVTYITISLPIGEKACFTIHSCIFNAQGVECSVIKDAGDDPDVTNGIEIRARLERITKDGEERVVVKGGEGVGRVSKPGLPVKIGMPAINPVPEKMIKESVLDVLKEYSDDDKNLSYRVTIIVPEGRERAKRTLNRRLGIIDGISILGTTGIVEPMSLDAYRAVIDTCLNIAIAAGADEVVFTPGRRSQKAAEKYLSFIEDAFIQAGDHVGYSLKLAAEKGIKRISIAGQLGKLSKIANGYFDTHACKSDVSFKKAAEWAKRLGYRRRDIDYISNSNTMLQVAEYMREHNGENFFNNVCERVCGSVYRFLDMELCLRTILVSTEGEILADISKRNTSPYFYAQY